MYSDTDVVSKMAEEYSDILIIGAGIFGTSAAYHLSSQHPNTSITVIDRTPFPPSHAASTDINKIIRQDYSSPFYMDLATEAMDAWDKWPELGGKGYFHRTGWINFSETGSDLAARIRRNFAARGSDPSEDVALDDAKTRFNGIFASSDFSEMSGAYWNPDAGWCDAAAATGEMMKAAISRGVKYVQDDVVKLVPAQEGIARVETRLRKSLVGGKVLLAAGAWTSSLMSGVEDALDIADADRTEQQMRAACVCVAHYKLTPHDLEALKAMPVTIFGDHGDCQPPPGCGLLKYTNGLSLTNTITTASGHRVSVPPENDQHTVPEKLQTETHERITSKLMSQFTCGRAVDYWRLCWDSVTPTQDHLISKHPDARLGNLYFAVGGSFHSYKFLPTTGKYIAKVLNGESNGGEKDAHWGWKGRGEGGRGAHEKAYPTRELRSMEG